MLEKDPILERIVHYAEVDPNLAQLALGLARLGQVIWQLEQRDRMQLPTAAGPAPASEPET